VQIQPSILSAWLFSFKYPGLKFSSLRKNQSYKKYPSVDQLATCLWQTGSTFNWLKQLIVGAKSENLIFTNKPQ
jgi:hypothetical protein